MRNLIYLSPVPWASFAQRPHKFVSWFREKYRGKILWIEPYASRLPKVADFRRIRARHSHEAVSIVPRWLTVASPKNLPIEPLLGSGAINKVLWNRTLMQATEFAQHEETVLVVGKPSLFATQLMKRLPECKSVYDAMDDFPAFYRGYSKFSMKRTERNVVLLADEIWASSSFLHERWRKKHTNVRLIHNGLDADSLNFPSSIPTTKDRIVFGYIGTVGEWFDWELIFKLARTVPDDIIRIIGPIYKPADRPLPRNIEMLPPCTHAKAMIEMAQFDVGLIPFLLNELTDSVDPIKYYEYRALRIPIISSRFGEMRYRDETDGVYLISDNSIVESAVQWAGKEVESKQIDINFIRENSWQARFDQTSL